MVAHDDTTLRGAVRLSACLIVRDEEASLSAALASLAFCDEIVVVDSGSTDRTVAIARESGAVVVENPWPGFGAQRNVALDHATGDWILEVDADETITPALAEEIRAFLADPPLREAHPLVALPMRHRFLGGWLEGATKYPGYRYRLFRRDSYRHDEDRAVHEGLTATTAVWAMRGDMTHELAATWREALGDTWRYATLEASRFTPRRSPLVLARGIVVRPAVKAVYRLLVDGAWRDGWRGAVKVGLDAFTDAAVWVLAAQRGGNPEATGSHYSAAAPAAGPVRIVGLATTAEATVTLTAWLLRAADAGADVALLTRVPPAAGDATGPVPGAVADRLRVVALPPGRLPALTRALDRERQVRRIDAVLTAQPLLERRLRSARRIALRGARQLRAADDPATATHRLHEDARGGAGR